jgi:soluble lytic murein transglycosylase
VSRRRGRRTAAGVRRRRLALVLGAAGFAVLAVLAYGARFGDVVQEVSLPLRHEDIIRQQAEDKALDPALIAAVIYAESRFIEGRVSSAGAIGLMQITPATAQDIARRSGGTAFELEDLDTPQVNISYGSYYLRYLLDRYGGNETLAVAAYNGGEGNVDRWIHEARSSDRAFEVEAIPFPETRFYVQKVLDAKRQYRRAYARELGL